MILWMAANPSDHQCRYLRNSPPQRTQRTQRVVPAGNGVPIDDASNSILQMWDVEVDQKANGSAAQFQIRDELCGVKRQKSFHCLEFHDHAVFYEKVDSIASIEANCLVHHRQFDLVFELQPFDRELVMQAGVVRALEQAGAKRRMDFERALEDSFSELFMSHHVFSSVSSVSSVVERGAAKQGPRRLLDRT